MSNLRDTMGQLTEEEWAEHGKETEELNQSLAQALRDGVKPGSAEANELVEKHRSLLSLLRKVSRYQHVQLGRMYTTQEKLREHYDGYEPGLARWLRSAIEENALANGTDPANVP